MAVTAMMTHDPAALQALDRLPAPIYATDSEGRITYYNPACIGFSGRVPHVGEDSWCVSWKLLTDDEKALPHDECPMATALKEKRMLRGMTAIAQRPDGTRVNFMAYPTPMLDDDGKLVGAVNLLLDVTSHKRARHLHEQAQRCKRLARSTTDSRTSETLRTMADEYEQLAVEMEQAD